MVAGENECVCCICGSAVGDVKVGVRGFDCWVLLNESCCTGGLLWASVMKK